VDLQSAGCCLLAAGSPVSSNIGNDPHVYFLSITPEQQKEILYKFNSIRREVQPTASNMLEMKWSEEAAENARKWAEQCQFRSSSVHERIVNGIKCGETLSQAMVANSWSDIIETWATKKSDFKYGIGLINPKKNIYTYTQLIWYSSYLMGCALAYCPKNNVPYIYACHYCPVGNIVRKLSKPYKSGPSCGRCPDSCEDKLCTNPCRYVDKITGCKTLKVMAKCDGDFLKKNCQATCNCKTEIV
uniref:Cysteine rich secretory protein 3 n=1 Tax=Salvator merianae TaxID=96440 RepID=A0A8D0BG46_SALMN